MTDMISMIILLQLEFHNYFRHIYQIVIKIQWHPGKTHHKRHLHIVRNSASPGFNGWHLITHPLVKLSRHAKSPSALPSGKPLVCVLFHRAQQNPAMLLVIQLHLLPCLTKNVKLRSEKMPQLMECLTCKHLDLTSIPSISVKANCSGTYLPLQCWRGRDRRPPGAC